MMTQRRTFGHRCGLNSDIIMIATQSLAMVPMVVGNLEVRLNVNSTKISFANTWQGGRAFIIINNLTKRAKNNQLNVAGFYVTDVC